MLSSITCTDGNPVMVKDCLAFQCTWRQCSVEQEGQMGQNISGIAKDDVVFGGRSGLIEDL